ncbi:hypothetical protein REB14_15745 [Chryseobacterium sp. ES2]|uniref:C1q domain-containing protein n=1 Tax=Chryseobacterium metallicongregator TaxID=3073042 RepID=A0ABU1E7J2_9FLAO|nr:hypothetical protein [Chryseobacterium sp. ES2]MDR4953632.1 hypothetical protein [Chryseobacterium sp. ES2]
MKKLFLMAAGVFSATVYSQVGVNTEAPNATLDIKAKNPTGSMATVDGLLIPAVDRERAMNMSPVRASTLIYVDNISTGTATGQASNVDSVGFYYFDENLGKWIKLNGESSTSVTQQPFIAMTNLSSGTFNMSANNSQQGVTFFEFIVSNGNLVMPPANTYKDRTISIRNSAGAAFGFTFQESYNTNQIAISLLTTRSIVFHSDGVRWYQLAGF